VETTVHPVLPGEPDSALLVERGGVEVDVTARLGQGPARHLPGLRVDADDRVGPTFGDPGRPVGADDHAVRRRSGAERDEIDLAWRGVEAAERTDPLRRVPGDTVGADGHVVRISAVVRQGV